MRPVDKVHLGFCMSVMAFCLTVVMSQSQGFCELNPILRFLFTEYNTYQVILIYTFMWGVILSLYNYAENKISVYQVYYLATIILLVGFFDLAHNILVMIRFL